MILVGSLPYYGLQFNMMTSINLIIGIGLCVDFSAHMGHAFLHSKSTGGHKKVVDAFHKVGLSIWNGAFSTFLALAPMVWCRSYIALLFWKMTTTVIVLGIYFGLCVLPVILAMFEGGDTYEDVFPPLKKLASGTGKMAKKAAAVLDEGSPVAAAAAAAAAAATATKAAVLPQVGQVQQNDSGGIEMSEMRPSEPSLQPSQVTVSLDRFMPPE